MTYRLNILMFLLLATAADASHISYTYLRIGGGEGGQAYAFKSRAECEAAKRRHQIQWKRMIDQLKKQVGNRGTFGGDGDPRCLNLLPLGYVRPKTGH